MHNVLLLSSESEISGRCKAALSSERSYRVIALPVGEQTQAIMPSERLDCVLQVWRRPGNDNEVQLLRYMKSNRPQVPILVILPKRDEVQAMCAMGAGACGTIVASDMTGNELLERVRTAIEIATDAAGSGHEQENNLILVVDDNPDDREAVMRLLRQTASSTYEYAEAESLDSMLDVMVRRKPSCVLLDYSMPGMNGLEILRTIMPRYPFLPIIMMTGQGSETIAAESIKSGAQSYLIKSKVSSDVLSTSIGAAIRQRALERERSELVQKLLDSNTALERFAYVASHDLQEPIRMIYSFGRILLDECHDKLDSNSREYLTMITDSGERMRDVVSDLLDYSRINNQILDRELFDGEFALNGALENLQNVISESKAQINHDRLPEVYGNPVQVMRLFQNIISNAIKYQPEGNIPKIGIRVDDATTHWQISISDNGIGIEPRFLQDIFSPFRRLHTWDEIKGSGLGLAICRKIAEANNGSISVISSPGKGSTFMIKLLKKNKRLMEAI
jgi:signal transduction histidine kinase